MRSKDHGREDCAGPCLRAPAAGARSSSLWLHAGSSLPGLGVQGTAWGRGGEELPLSPGVTKACVTAGPEGWAPSPLSDGTASPRLQAVPTSRRPASCSQTSPGSSNKGGVWVTHGRAGQGAGPGRVPSLGWGQGQCQGIGPTARPLAVGMLWPGSGDRPRGSSPDCRPPGNPGLAQRASLPGASLLWAGRLYLYRRSN